MIIKYGKEYLKELFSIRVDMQYRLEFSLEEVGGESLVTICQLEELSNHYKQ